MIRIKPGVRVLGLRPEAVLALSVAEGAYRDAGVLDLYLTSGIEGKHSFGSDHYKGDAIDVRTHNARSVGVDVPGLAATIKEALGPDYDVLLEHVGQENEHIHVEFDPKSPY